MRKFDFHTHFFPSTIAHKTISHLSNVSGLTPECEGTLDALVSQMDSYGVEKSLLLPIATNAKQQENVNNFAIDVNGYQNKIMSFGSVYPQSDSSITTLEYLVSNGIKGIKLHPEYQEFEADDKKIYSIYEFCQKRNLIISFHCGKDLAFPTRCNCSPKMIKTIAKDFPELKIVAAHLGGWDMWTNVLEYLCGLKNVWLDTAFISSYIEPALFLNIIEQHGIDKILFGTDSPWSNCAKESELIDSIGFSQNDLEKIYYKNAETLLGL